MRKAINFPAQIKLVCKHITEEDGKADHEYKLLTKASSLCRAYGRKTVLARAIIIEMLKPYALKLFNKDKPFLRRYKLVNDKLYLGKREICGPPPVSYIDTAHEMMFEVTDELSDFGRIYYSEFVTLFLWESLKPESYKNLALLTRDACVVKCAIEVLGHEGILEDENLEGFRQLVWDWNP